MILITGGAGFIGSHLSSSLDKEEIIVLDNLDNYYDVELKKNNIKMNSSNENYRFVKGDIRTCEVIFKEFDINKVVHLAAKGGVRNSLMRPYSYIDTNVNGTLKLLEMARKYDVEKFVFSSSSSVYGNNKKTPFTEEDPCNNIISPYASTKLMGENFCNMYSELYGLPTTVFRFFTVYGPRQRPDMAFNKFMRLLLSGEPIEDYGNLETFRDYTYVSDIVSGIKLGLEHKHKHNVFNLGREDIVKLKDAINMIGNLLNVKPKFTKAKDVPLGDVPFTYSDTSKASKILGYNPEVSIKEGLEKMVAWYKGDVVE